VLCTDTSSLGSGGGDFKIDDAPEELATLIRPMLGRWAGKRIVFAGDYTEVDEYQEYREIDNEETVEVFTDISSDLCIAVWAMVICELIDSDITNLNKSKLKDDFLEYLNTEISPKGKNWNDCKNVKVILRVIDELNTTEQNTTEQNTTEQNTTSDTPTSGVKRQRESDDVDKN